jgi:non-heme chloroperoxidase
MPRIQTIDHTELFYRDWGTGRPVVFVHGMPMTGDMWQYQMLYLAERGFRAIAYDRRGHGRSDDPGTGYEFDTLADDLGALLDQLDLTGATLVGHSMGGGEITRYLSRYRNQRVSKIVLVSSTVPKVEVEAQAAVALLERLRTGYSKWVAENAALSFGAEVPGHLIEPLDKERTIRDWMGVSLNAVGACMAVNLSTDFTTEVREIAVPTLIVHGDCDVFAPLDTCGRRVAELVPDGRLLIYEGAAHLPHLSHRRRLSADLLTFAAL